jgi:tripartite-type tricarboxylate transporter receptor subunit TctC
VLGEKLSEVWSKPVVVESVTGSGGNLATERVIRAAPDGHTLLMASSGMIVVNPSLYRKLSFDPGRDLDPVAHIGFTPNILVIHPDVSANTVAELVRLAREQPGKLTFGSGGLGSSNHLAGEMFKSSAGIDIQHVPYRGIAQAVPDLLGGRIAMLFANAPAVRQLIQDGRLKALAVTSADRSAAHPELPTMQQSGFPLFEVTTWYGVMAPAGTSRAIVAQLHADLQKVLASATVRRRLEEAGIELAFEGPPDFGRRIETETDRWRKLIEKAGIKAVE